jgi:hypothetical protein
MYCEYGLPLSKHISNVTKECSVPLHRNNITALASKIFADNQILNSVSSNSVHNAT